MAQRGRPKGDDRQKRRILDAVIRLTVLQDSSTIHLRSVAEEAGVSVGMIQYHFGSRENMMNEASQEYLLAVVSSLRNIAAQDLAPWDKLTALCRRVGSTEDSRDRVIVWIDLLAQATRRDSPREATKAINQAWTELLIEIIEEGTEAGDFAPAGGSIAVAQQLVAFVDGLDVAVASGMPGADADWRDAQLFAVAGALLGRHVAAPSANTQM